MSMCSPKYPNTSRHHVSPPQPVTTRSKYLGRVTIGKLSDEVLLNIFRYYLDAFPRFWPRLVHICRKWRHIVFASQRDLHLRLFCTHGTLVLKTLDYWPALPIVLENGGSLTVDPPAPEDEDNIMAALRQSDRVGSINLTVTSSLLVRLYAIKRPFLELEDLVLLSRDNIRLPSAFRWGPRLRTLHLTGIAFPSFLQPLPSYKNLVDLRLHEIPSAEYGFQDGFANALAGMARLQSLSLHFLFPVEYPSTAHNLALPSLSRKRVVLPVLTRLNFRGVTNILESLVAKIEAPRLGDIEVAFIPKITDTFVFNDFTTYNVPELRKFIDRIEMDEPYRRAYILISGHAVSIFLIQPGAPTCLKLHMVNSRSSEPLSYMARICNHFSTYLFHVEDLRVSTTVGPRWWRNGLWQGLISSFTGVKWFHVSGDLSTHIGRDLQRGPFRNLLPVLRKLYILQSGPRLAPLSEAVVSFVVSRRLSGHHIAVEYERLGLCHIGEPHGTGLCSQHVTIEMLSDDILLKIFRHCLDATPQFWPTLARLCQRWRQIIFTSPLGLNLRLYFTYGTPVLKTLDFWPALPIIVQYGGFPNLDPPDAEDDDNIIAALKQSGRVSSIGLTVTSSLLKKLSAISGSFSDLEELALLSRDNMRKTLPSTFRWGPRLRTLHSTRIAFPSFPRLLSPSQDLVDVQLHEIPSAGYFPPEAFANALSGMTQLRTLSLHFLSLPPRRNYLGFPPQLGEYVILPALISLKYRGTSKYLDNFVARIDAPRLGDIDITFFSQPTMDASELGRFIERTDMQTSLSQAKIQTSGHAISISFTNSSTSTPLRLQISCEQLDWQLSSMAQVCDQFSPFIFRINGLCVHTTQSTSGQDDVGEQWPDLIRAFGGANDFRVAGVYTTDILCTLRPTDGGNTSDTTVLPSLRNLRVEGPMAMHGPLWDAVQSFITSQRLSGRHVQVYAREYTCHICDRSFTEQQELKKHLVDEHLHRILCSYCGNFECMPGYNNLFQRHLESKHPEVAHADTLNSNPALQSSSFSSSYSGSPGTQYNDPRASLTDIFGPLTMLRSAQISTFEDIPTFSDDTIDHFPPSPTWSFESGSEDT